MLPMLADENFNNDIVRGLRRRLPSIDLVRAQDVGLSGAKDPPVLAWAAQAKRVIFSHDVKTMTGYAYERVAAGLSMPGLFEVSDKLPIGVVIEEMLLLAECSLEGEWEGQVRYLPLR
jgi:hypothetical protein